MGGKLVVVLVALFATLAVSGSAQGTKPGPGATLTVGKQSASCPSPDYLRIRVTIEPTSVKAKRIAPDEQNLRSGKGAIIAVLGDKSSPITVDISGVTVDANGVDATVGIVYVDAQGTIS